MQSKLDKLKKRVTKGEESDLVGSLYCLIKELKCLPEIIGREFEVEYEEIKIWKFKWYRIKRIKQLPMSIPGLITLLNEMDKDFKKQKKDMRKSNSRKR